jgi:GNAT superfamily N-acetyltransferase
MDIDLYEDWMRPQILKLFANEYGISEEEFSSIFDNFYDHPYQKGKCIRIIAKEDKTVIGFQSFFYWPYTCEGTRYNVFQSGNSLVHPDHRGKGVFRHLLDYLEKNQSTLKIDTLVGFPIDVSVGSLIRNKWSNILNLNWYIKPISFFSLFRKANYDELQKIFPYKSVDLVKEPVMDMLKMATDKEFAEWRKTLYSKNKYYSFHFKNGEGELLLEMKLNIRKKYIKELIIGNLCSSNYDKSFLELALKSFVSRLRETKCIGMVSMALNRQGDVLLEKLLQQQGFRRIERKIYFCVKPFSEAQLFKDPARWMIYRGDIDTW